MKNNAIKHMNEEHGDIVEAMALKFGSLQNAKGAKIVDIDDNGLDIDVNGNIIRVPFTQKANQNGQGYKEAIMEICKDLKPNGDKLAKISSQLLCQMQCPCSKSLPTDSFFLIIASDSHAYAKNGLNLQLIAN